MGALSKCVSTTIELLKLVQINTYGIQDDTLEKFCEWIKQQCEYIGKEKQPFTVNTNQIPMVMSIDSYNYLMQKIPEIVNRYYAPNGSEYSFNGNVISLNDATEIYCAYNLVPRNIIWVEFGFNIGNEFGGKHPAIILKNIQNRTLLVAPVSSNDNGSHVASNTVITFSGSDMYNMTSSRNRFTSVDRITPISIYRVGTLSKVGSLKKYKYQEILSKAKNFI